MIPVTITPVYVALIALVMLVLSARVSKLRVKQGISLGSGGDGNVDVAIRGFGNLTEYAPIILIMLLMMELQGIQELWLHVYGAVFLIARILHPMGLFDQRGAPKWKRLSRQIGSTATLVLLLVGPLTLLSSLI